jgi:uncharacterized protein YfiM (DUF2279 family)
LTVSRRAGDLVGNASTLTKSCAIVPDNPVLGGRTDLAKHWALSAAMAATVGTEVSSAMGMWKEISDSGPSGSGFSFVDLTADRSGIQFARALLDEETTSATRARLLLAQDADLLPVAALALSEGMSATDFSKRFQSVDSAEYQKQITLIDRLLAQRLARPAK